MIKNVATCWGSIALAFMVLPFACASVVHADIVWGPHMRYESSRGGEVESLRDDGLKGDTSHRYQLVSLFAPIGVDAPVTFVPWVDLHRDQRDDDFPQNETPHHLPTTRSMLAAGFALVGQQAFPPITPLLTVKRFGDPRLAAKRRPMTEIQAGGQWPNAFFPGDVAMVIFRWREYPYQGKFLPIAGYKRRFDAGYFFDVLVPAHGLVGYVAPTLKWVTSGGFRITARDYPTWVFDEPIWLEGYTSQIFWGGSIQLVGPLHLRLDGGVQREVVTAMSEANETLFDYRTSFTPWFQLSLETIVKR